MTKVSSSMERDNYKAFLDKNMSPINVIEIQATNGILKAAQ